MRRQRAYLGRDPNVHRERGVEAGAFQWRREREASPSCWERKANERTHKVQVAGPNERSRREIASAVAEVYFDEGLPTVMAPGCDQEARP